MVKEAIKNYKLKIKNYGLFLIFIFHFSFFIFNCLFGYASLDSYWNIGEPVRGLSARSLSMGGAAIASSNDASSLFSNPSLMKLADGQKGLANVSPGLVFFFDKRNHSYLSTDYVTTDSMYFQMPSASILWSASKRNDVVFGFGFFSDLNSDYNFEEKDATAGTTDKLAKEGGFHDWALGMNWVLADWGSVGFTYLWGRGKSITDYTYITTSQSGDFITKTSDYQTLTGDNFVFGGNFSYEDKFNFGLTYRSNFALKVNDKNSSGSIFTVTESVFEMPYILGFGSSYNFKDSKDSKITFDAIFSNWGDSKYWLTKLNGVKQIKTKLNPLYKNVWEYHLGFEHSPSKKTTLRYGFSYLPDYPNPSEAMPSVSFGLGIIVGRAIVDVAGDYAFRRATQERISQTATGFDDVAESRLKLLSTVGYKW
ncbi:MAG: hypothetical protein Q7K21_08405 [Elusimicrobiota bacterium]|nr:hypothetical protein [Elusimicrobiota bacterium]